MKKNSAALARPIGISVIVAVIAFGVVAGGYASHLLAGASSSNVTASSYSNQGISGASATTGLEKSGQSTSSSFTIWSMPPASKSIAYNGTWEFVASASQGETSLAVQANLTYIGSASSLFIFGDPTSLAQVVAPNGTIAWSEVSTDLLLSLNVTYWKSFAVQIQVPTTSLQLGENYTLLVYPQVRSAVGGQSIFGQQDLELEFTFSPLASTDFSSSS